MANIKGIELASEIYDLEDTSARNTATSANQTATQASQTVTQVQTTLGAVSEKTDLAYAETMDNKRNIGDLAWLETETQDDLVSAINEVNGTLETETLTFTGGSTVLKRKGNLLFIDSRIEAGSIESYPASVGENVPERFRPTQNLRLTVYNNNADQPIGQFVYNSHENRFRMYVSQSLRPQGNDALVATGVTPLW